MQGCYDIRWIITSIVHETPWKYCGYEKWEKYHSSVCYLSCFCLFVWINILWWVTSKQNKMPHNLSIFRLLLVFLLSEDLYTEVSIFYLRGEDEAKDVSCVKSDGARLLMLPWLPVDTSTLPLLGRDFFWKMSVWQSVERIFVFSNLLWNKYIRYVIYD